MEVVGTPTPDLLKKICSEHVRQEMMDRGVVWKKTSDVKH